jgi:CubicO group peptidase (beta-lactamase class C family)
MRFYSIKFYLLAASCALSTIVLDAQKITDFDGLFQSICTSTAFEGVVLIADQGEKQYIASNGTADRKLSIPITPDTRFRIASITKTFTAVMIMQLLEQGKLALEDPISMYYPEYRGAGRDSIHIIHLLQYASGLPDCEGGKGLKVYQKPIAPADFVNQYCSGKPDFTPGTEFRYDNGGYIILGRIIEKITGMTFETALRKMILDVVNMPETGMLRSSSLPSDLALTYTYNKERKTFQPDEFYLPEVYDAAGAMYSTAEDLFRFDAALFGGKLVKPETLKIMLKANHDLHDVAIGFWVTMEEIGAFKIKMTNRMGSILGANAIWLHMIRENKTIIILSNNDASDLVKIALMFAQIASGQAIEIPQGKP